MTATKMSRSERIVVVLNAEGHASAVDANYLRDFAGNSVEGLRILITARIPKRHWSLSYGKALSMLEWALEDQGERILALEAGRPVDHVNKELDYMNRLCSANSGMEGYAALNAKRNAVREAVGV